MSPDVNTGMGDRFLSALRCCFIKTLILVFICVDGLSGDGTRNSSIFLYIKRTCINVSPFFVPKSVPKVVFLCFLDIK